MSDIERELLWSVRGYFVEERNKIIDGWRWIFFNWWFKPKLAVIDAQIDILDYIIDKPNRDKIQGIMND